jgi:hypothetical protein
MLRKVCDVTNEQFKVLVVEYNEADMTNIKKFVGSLSETSNKNCGKGSNVSIKVLTKKLFRHLRIFWT